MLIMMLMKLEKNKAGIPGKGVPDKVIDKYRSVNGQLRFNRVTTWKL